VRLEGLGQLKKFTSSGLEHCDLPACSIVSQPTTLPRAIHDKIVIAVSSLQVQMAADLYILLKRIKRFLTREDNY
jgi:hypothetical protein